MNSPTTDPLVDPPLHKGWRRFRRGIGILLTLLIFASPLLIIITLPKVIISPGSSTPVGPAIQIQGAKVYKPAKNVDFLTVEVSNKRPSVLQVLGGWLDPNDDIENQKDVFGNLSQQQNDVLNNQLMQQSQAFATKVALQRLGYTVPEHGSGALVVEVVKGSPADDKIKVGDTITAVNGQPVQTADQLGPMIRQLQPGSTAQLAVTRNKKKETIDVVTGKNKDGQAMIGVAPETRNLRFDFPVTVKINPGEVSGPSAGLAFTLAIIDELTPGNLTDHVQVAATGEIGPEGQVVEVGGVRQKAIAAKRAGAKLMLVPRTEVKDAKKSAGHGLRVVPVNNLNDALRALEQAGGKPVPPASVLTAQRVAQIDANGSNT